MRLEALIYRTIGEAIQGSDEIDRQQRALKAAGYALGLGIHINLIAEPPQPHSRAISTEDRAILKDLGIAAPE